MQSITQVCSQAKKKITPSPRLRRFVEGKAEEIRLAVEHQCQKEGLNAEVRLDGSVAKNTWIRDHVDADIFMRVSPMLTKQQLEDVCLPIARRALRPHKVVERFAEHPYVESLVEYPTRHLKVNVVPCYRVAKGEWMSATDRTPFHTDYIRSRLSSEKLDEVRLLKAFLRGIGSYGADIKTGGFSGMLCETLIVSHGTFVNALQDLKEWNEERFIDVEHYYAGREGEVHRIFREPLIVIDPVDKGRNLGSAVRPEQLWNFVSASRHFLAKPSTRLFSEPRIEPLGVADYRHITRQRGSTLLCLPIRGLDAVVDIVWSQLYRTQRALRHFLENNDFMVIRSAAWSDERELNVLLFELDTDRLPASRRHLGPPVLRAKESQAFLTKHGGLKGTLAGPWIEDDRWIVEKRRTTSTASALLETALSSGGAKIGVASLFQPVFKKRLVILKDAELARLISDNPQFAMFMRTYLAGRPVWLN